MHLYSIINSGACFCITKLSILRCYVNNFITNNALISQIMLNCIKNGGIIIKTCKLCVKYF